MASQVQTLHQSLDALVAIAGTNEISSRFACQSLEGLLNALQNDLALPNYASIAGTQAQIDPSRAIRQFSGAGLQCPPSQIPFSQQHPFFMPFSSEVARVGTRLSGFDYKTSRIWKLITSHFGSDIKQESLLQIAKHLSSSLSVSLDRDAKRRKIVLIKWFDENSAQITPLISDYSVKDDKVYYKETPLDGGI